MNNIIFITGMAGAGKSTVGRLVARHFPKCLFIQVDELREKMVKGYARPEAGVFTEEVIQQFQMARCRQAVSWVQASSVKAAAAVGNASR